jgi:hypothetical protein
MNSSYTRLVRSNLSPVEAAEQQVVDGLAAELRRHIASRAEEIRHVHVHGAQSLSVQRVVAELLCGTLEFRQEVVLTPQEGFVTRARPDFYRQVSPGRGILAEVERGGTITNNHDLKDLWKCHIALDAQHLFLIVPVANWSESGRAREKPFLRVSQRLGAFFGDARREVDVVSAHVFGYGAVALA